MPFPTFKAYKVKALYYRFMCIRTERWLNEFILYLQTYDRIHNNGLENELSNSKKIWIISEVSMKFFAVRTFEFEISLQLRLCILNP